MIGRKDRFVRSLVVAAGREEMRVWELWNEASGGLESRPISEQR